ncbi:hypothetical protein [Fictibacillus nanhaiensis]
MGVRDAHASFTGENSVFTGGNEVFIGERVTNIKTRTVKNNP